MLSLSVVVMLEQKPVLLLLDRAHAPHLLLLLYPTLVFVRAIRALEGSGKEQ